VAGILHRQTFVSSRVWVEIWRVCLDLEDRIAKTFDHGDTEKTLD